MKTEVATKPRELIPADNFIQQLGISRTTFWRWRKRGWVTTVWIASRQYISAAEVENFNNRAQAGEFAAKNQIQKGGAK